MDRILSRGTIGTSPDMTSSGRLTCTARKLGACAKHGPKASCNTNLHEHLFSMLHYRVHTSTCCSTTTNSCSSCGQRRQMSSIAVMFIRMRCTEKRRRRSPCTFTISEQNAVPSAGPTSPPTVEMWNCSIGAGERSARTCVSHAESVCVFTASVMERRLLRASVCVHCCAKRAISYDSWYGSSATRDDGTTYEGRRESFHAEG